MKRDSNAELLRIICIIFILLHHFCVHALFPEVGKEKLVDTEWDSQLMTFLHGFLYIGVNCFVMISGYYGIKTTMSRFVRLYLTYFFYSALALLYTIGYTYFFVSPDFSLDVKAIFHAFVSFIFPFRLGEIWFMTCYIALFLIAPLLHMLIERINKKEYIWLLIILTVVNVYFGYFTISGVVNYTGYNIVHFVWLYFIGNFLKEYMTEDFRLRNRWKFFAGYVVGACLWGTLAWLKGKGVDVPTWRTFCYHNPFLLINTVCFFLFIMSFRFQSRFVNCLASSTLGVFLLNEKVVGYQILQPFSHVFSPMVNVAVWLGLAIAFYVVAVVLDKLLHLIINPLLRCYNKRLDPKWQKWVKKVEKRIEKATE
ncbi:MAG: acyltransferase [Paludibacteraceae bacterium]|nr:acyltransferase [Paludibacteraceae bacterium]